MQSSSTSGFSPLSIRHRFVAPSTCDRPLNNHPHFVRNPSDISQPVMSQGGDQAMIHVAQPRRQESPHTARQYSRPTARPHQTSQRPGLGGLVPRAWEIGQSSRRAAPFVEGWSVGVLEEELRLGWVGDDVGNLFITVERRDEYSRY